MWPVYNPAYRSWFWPLIQTIIKKYVLLLFYFFYECQNKNVDLLEAYTGEKSAKTVQAKCFFKIKMKIKKKERKRKRESVPINNQHKKSAYQHWNVHNK